MFMSLSTYFESQEFWMLQFRPWFDLLSFLLSLPVLFFSAQDYFITAWKGLKAKFLTLNVPIALGISVLFLRSTYVVFFSDGLGYFDSLNGLVYVALAGAVLTKSAVEGVFYMLAFGLGTTPLLLFIIFFGPLQQKIRGLAFQKVLPWVTLIFGLWILIRGLGLGIPFWSPKPEMMNVQTEMHQH